MTLADDSRGGRVFTAVHLCACLLFCAQYLKSRCSYITKLGTEMFQYKSWESIYFGVKRSKVNVTSHKNIACVGAVH